MNLLLTIAQRLAERVSRRVVLKRRLPARYGGDPIFVSPGALLKLWWPRLETVDPHLFAWAAELVAPGSVIWDVGANVGLFSFAAAGLAGSSGQVVAIEADIWLAGLLRRSAHCQSPQRAPVEVLPVAVSDRVQIAHFHIAARGRAANYLAGAEGSSQTGGIRETQSVMAVTLDWLLGQRPTPQLVKIDVEGAEYQALRGAQRLLAEARPLILCEVRSSQARQVSHLLHEHGYTLYDLSQQRERHPVQLAAFNTLAVPSPRHGVRISDSVAVEVG